jgi:hypothetical protein
VSSFAKRRTRFCPCFCLFSASQSQPLTSLVTLKKLVILREAEDPLLLLLLPLPLG